MQNSRALRAPIPDLRASGGCGFFSQTPISPRRFGSLPPDSKHSATTFANSWLLACLQHGVVLQIVQSFTLIFHGGLKCKVATVACCVWKFYVVSLLFNFFNFNKFLNKNTHQKNLLFINLKIKISKCATRTRFWKTLHVHFRPSSKTHQSRILSTLIRLLDWFLLN